MSADAFGAFEDVGLNSEEKVKEVGLKFRDTILSLGGGIDPMTVFKEFRGQQPSPDALLRQYRPVSFHEMTTHLLPHDFVLKKINYSTRVHLELAKKMIEENKCISRGPTGQPVVEVPTGALFVFTDLESAQSYADNDPYVANGIVTRISIVEWNAVLQKEYKL
jgi:uncharacterized protein YciI